MKTKNGLLLPLLVLGVLLILAVGVAYAQGAFDLPWWTVDGGGGDSQGGIYTLSGAIGQPDAARSHGGGYTLSGGFWAGPGLQMYLLHLPVVLKP